MQPTVLVEAFHAHCIKVITQMRRDIELGMPAILASSFALVALERFTAMQRPVARPCVTERKFVRLQQAIQIAIDFWSQAKNTDAIGQAAAQARQEEYAELLVELNGSSDIPFYAKQSSN